MGATGMHTLAGGTVSLRSFEKYTSPGKKRRDARLVRAAVTGELPGQTQPFYAAHIAPVMIFF